MSKAYRINPKSGYKGCFQVLQIYWLIEPEKKDNSLIDSDLSFPNNVEDSRQEDDNSDSLANESAINLLGINNIQNLDDHNLNFNQSVIDTPDITESSN